MAFLVILMFVSFFFVTSAAEGQVYLYGRADFQAGTNGMVIVADFNGDGRPDLAVSDPQNDSIDILLGSSNGGFVLSGEFTTGSYPTALVAADFNGDKKLDLAVVDGDSGTISILLGNGDGTFQSHVDYPVGQSPVGIVAADFNSDGNIDLATISTNESAVAIMLGDGKGGFEVQRLIPVASAPTLLAGGDVNGDGKVDLITSNDSYDSPSITVLVSKGDGTFTQVQSQAPTNATALAVGDFNGDGKLDALIMANDGDSLYLSFGNGDGTFQSPVSIPNAPYSFNSQAVLVGDVNHDRKLDIVLPGVWVMLGNGDGTFQNPVLSPANTSPTVVFDINGDGQPDLVCISASSYNGSPGMIVMLLGNGDGTFMETRNVALASSSYSPGAGVAADFNGDGKLDLAVAESAYPNAQVSVELGKGNGTFRQPIVSPLSSTAGTSFMLAADFNGDHKPDLLVLDSGSGFQVLLGNGDGTFGTPVDTPLTYPIYWLAAGDFNGDGKADLAITVNNSSSSYLNIYLSNGDGTFTLGQQYSVYPNSYVTAADVNGDGKPDLVVDAVSTYGGAYNLLVFLGNGDGTFRGPVFGPRMYYSSQTEVADFNGDGKPDIAVLTSASSSSAIAFLAGNGDGTFVLHGYSDVGVSLSGPLSAGDFTGDGNLDLVAGSGCCGSGGSVILPGYGDGTFGSPLEYDFSGNGSYGASAIAGDFNSDGVSDLGLSGENASNAPVVFLYLSTPAPNIFPTALNFGKEPVGKTSAPKKVTLTNSGNARMKISGIKVSGDFLEQNNCGKKLGVGRSCTIQVSFKPTAKGLRKGTVSIADNAPGSPQMVGLTGTGE
jgi:hypothetical protein